jgi:N-acetylglucosamine-6-phosphate deacetylase
MLTKSMAILTARTLITGVGTVAYPAITVRADGLIEDISTDPKIESDAILTPAFFDIHVHGAAGFDVMDAGAKELAQVQRFLASKGTGHYLPTTVTAPVDATLAALERLADAIERRTPEDEAVPVGVHLEGPFLSHAKRGVHPAELLQRPSVELFERFQEAARGHIRLLTIAPEAPGALELIEYASGRGVKVSLGHTNATAAEALAGIAAGATSATHTFNAMRAMDHREPGVAGVVLDSPGLYAELICDGVHVAPAMVRIWRWLKGERGILITDGISATGMGDGEFALGGLAVSVSGGKCTLKGSPGTLAGSVLTLDRAVANFMEFTGCSLEEAVRCAGAHPAEMLGVDVGVVRVGEAASLNEYSGDGRLVGTWLRGVKIGA